MRGAAGSESVLIAAAGLDVATGLALVVAPSLFALLVLGGDLDGKIDKLALALDER